MLARSAPCTRSLSSSVLSTSNKNTISDFSYISFKALCCVTDRHVEILALPDIPLRPEESEANDAAGTQGPGRKIADIASQAGRLGVAVGEARPIIRRPAHARRLQSLEAKQAAGINPAGDPASPLRMTTFEIAREIWVRSANLQSMIEIISLLLHMRAAHPSRRRTTRDYHVFRRFRGIQARGCMAGFERTSPAITSLSVSADRCDGRRIRQARWRGGSVSPSDRAGSELCGRL